MQHEILAPLPLHHADGQLNQPGWARQAYWQYQRSAVPASSWRIKEWDYYAVVSPEGFAFSLTASNLGYAGLYALCVVDLNQDKQQVFEGMIREQMRDGETGAFLVWVALLYKGRDKSA